MNSSSGSSSKRKQGTAANSSNDQGQIREEQARRPPASSTRLQWNKNRKLPKRKKQNNRSSAQFDSIQRLVDVPIERFRDDKDLRAGVSRTEQLAYNFIHNSQHGMNLGEPSLSHSYPQLHSSSAYSGTNSTTCSSNTSYTSTLPPNEFGLKEQALDYIYKKLNLPPRRNPVHAQDVYSEANYFNVLNNFNQNSITEIPSSGIDHIDPFDHGIHSILQPIESPRNLEEIDERIKELEPEE